MACIDNDNLDEKDAFFALQYTFECNGASFTFLSAFFYYEFWDVSASASSRMDWTGDCTIGRVDQQWDHGWLVHSCFI